MAVFLNGKGLHCQGSKGEKLSDDSFYIIFNAHFEPLTYQLPQDTFAMKWVKVIDTLDGSFQEDGKEYPALISIDIAGRSIVLFKAV